MKSVVIVFPASNCDRDVAVALQKVTGGQPVMVWHGDAQLPECDLIVLPGGFSYGDYLRTGAMAAHSPIMREVKTHAERGVPVLGICNGFQVLTESGLLPGALMTNANLKFVCRSVSLRVENTDTLYTHKYPVGASVVIPVAHHGGNYFADEDALDRLEGEGQVVFRYEDNPNGSARDIAGIINSNGRVMGLMPHPERVIEPELGGTDGIPLFQGIMERLA